MARVVSSLVERVDAGFRSPFCANVPKADLKPFVNRNFRQFMPEEAQYAYMATRDALASARLEQDYIDQHEVGIIYGNDSVAEATMRALDKFREFGSTAACGSGAIFQSMNSTVTMNLTLSVSPERYQSDSIGSLCFWFTVYWSGLPAG